jgi:hypothetical protein
MTTLFTLICRLILISRSILLYTVSALAQDSRQLSIHDFIGTYYLDRISFIDRDPRVNPYLPKPLEERR